MNFYLFSVILLQLLSPFRVSSPPDHDEANIRVNQFISFIHEYCSSDYRLDNIQYIIGQCIDPSILVDNDIPGIYKNKDELILYLGSIKKYKIQIRYDREFSIENCSSQSGKKLGCFVKKTIIADGITKEYNEFIELTVQGNTYKIISIQSNLFPASVDGINCNQKEIDIVPAQVAEAEKELNTGNEEVAIAQYLEVRPMKTISSPVMEKKIATINLDSVFIKKFGEANSFYASGKFEEALSVYEFIVRCHTTISPEFKGKVTSKIELCNDQLIFESTLQYAHLYFSQGDYENALAEYNKCLAIRPNDVKLKEKISICNRYIAEFSARKALADIQRGENLIDTGDKNNIRTGFSLLMKYVHSGKLNGMQFFKMAQIVDTNRNKYLDKDLNITDQKACVLARHFMLEAKSLDGYDKDDFDYIWKQHFNKHSRSCD